MHGRSHYLCHIYDRLKRQFAQLDAFEIVEHSYMSILNRMMLILAVLLLTVSSNSYSKVISGIGYLDFGGWDFSDTTSVHPDYADISLAIVVDPPIGLMVFAHNGASVVHLPDSTFENLKHAPEDSSMYDIDVPAYLSQTYVARTQEGHYAKFRFLRLPYQIAIIEYVYQPDGSRNLTDEIGTESYTWGAIKKIFQ